VSRTSWLLLAGSIVLAGILVAALLAVTDLGAVTDLLSRARPGPFVLLVLVLGFNAVLAGEKWRTVDDRLERENRDPLPGTFYFVLSAIGVAVGQVAPVQVGTALSRSIGSHFYGGRAIMRGTGATIFEQFFDLLVAAYLAVASAVVLLTGAGEAAWALLAVTMAVAGLFLTTIAVRVVAIVAHRLGRVEALAGRRRVLALLENVAGSALLAPAVARRLYVLSLVRFAGLCAMSALTCAAVGLDIPIWHLAGMVPFAVLANLIAITPGALGISEWTVVSILVMFGTSFSVAAQLAVVTRVLVAGAALIVGLFALVIAVAVRRSWSR
jgi:uncharacterized protein (TIRG00374 family)